eukprot:11174958-Alexandrium_andersonii.AAC.1
MSASLVGSEMCIRDRACTKHVRLASLRKMRCLLMMAARRDNAKDQSSFCLLYTSDAADDM